VHSVQRQAASQADGETTLVERRLRLGFWLVGFLLATMQAWAYRHYISADGIAYLDMSDAVFPGIDWHRLITGTWSPFYPFLLGLFRLLNSDPYHEVIIGHLFNIAIFLCTLAAFEFLFDTVVREQPDSANGNAFLPRWVYLVVAYSLFLWAAIGQITLRSLRADMLMAAFLFLAVGILYRIWRRPATWARYFALGVTLGLGYLTKAPMLVIGALVIGSTLVFSRDRTRTLPKAALSVSLLLAIGSLYFIPLSQKRGHLTFGDAGKLNYLLYVDKAGPAWYLQHVGQASGMFLHSATRIFDQPPVYRFSLPETVSHPMRYDPAYWIEGAKPRFSFSGQVRNLIVNVKECLHIAKGTWAVVAAIVLLLVRSGGGWSTIAAVMQQWPLWLIGFGGLAMFAMVHVEPRYVGAFFLLAWMGLFVGLRIPQRRLKLVGPVFALAIAASILIPMVVHIGSVFLYSLREPNVDADVARELGRMGIRAGDKIARISPNVNDYAWVHMLRATIVTEVDMAHTREFWNATPVQQDRVLRTMANTGVRIVVAYISGSLTPAGWQRLGATPFCIRWLNGA